MSTPPDRQTVRFSQADLELFRDASGDRNPLHLSRDYASKTAYGQQVVFGALGAVACLGRLGQLSPCGNIAKLTADFHRPMFLGVNYTLRASGQCGSETVRLQDGTVPVLTLSAQYGGKVQGSPDVPGPAHFERTEANELSFQGLNSGTEVNGTWAADGEKTGELCHRWGVDDAGRPAAEALMWSSYAVGMELPGKSALFFRVALEFEAAPITDGSIAYSLKVTGVNKTISQLKLKAELMRSGQPYAHGQVVAFVRPEMPPVKFSEIGSTERQPFAGKVAVIIGASRGLGAAIAASLAAGGAHVIGLSRSGASWRDGLPQEVLARISTEAADASDEQALGALSARIRDRFGRLDFLICSAFPAIPSLRLEENATDRIRAYLARSTDLVLAPLCAFLPMLNESKGCTVIVSSVAVEKPVRDWPHYVAAKNAVEGLGLVAPLQYPDTGCLLIRPDKLLTDMTNTPMGRQNAASPLAYAAQICRALEVPPLAGTSRVFHGSDGE
jgi:NAD(P)-dependent dehydrogenase (short-subunit alcohol dehydrogenase family)